MVTEDAVWIPRKKLHPLGVLLPLARCEDSVLLRENLQTVASVMPEGTRFYIGQDDDDPRSIMEVENMLSLFETIGLRFAAEIPANIIGIANTLSVLAYDDGCDYFVLFGDDVKISDGWYTEVLESFKKLDSITHLQGFGCVALKDLTFIGFPTFPVVSRLHIEIFGQYAFNEFINQGADPFIYAVYGRWGASIFAQDTWITNTIGGDEHSLPRYERAPVEWKFDILRRGVEKVTEFLEQRGHHIKKRVCLDVVVPSFRGNLDLLSRICNLEIPDECTTQIIIILDNPELYPLRNYLETRYEEKVRVRVNNKNSGASYSRNRGLDESAGDWVLFLDDNVIVPPGILQSYADAIGKHGTLYSGFVMPTEMPRIATVWSAGVKIMHLLHFWSKHIHENFYVRWGVTAQICLRQGKARFDEDFPKTGGGEDIDMCLSVQGNNGDKPICTILNSEPMLHNISSEMMETAQRQCVHEWWDGGKVQSKRFYGWGYGDSLLIKKWKKHAYISFPNALECTVFIIIQAAVTFPYQNKDSIMQSILLIDGVWCTQIFLDVANAVMSDAAPSVEGTARVASAFVGSVFYKWLGTELGHLVGPIC